MFIYFFILRIASLFNRKARLLVRGQGAALSLITSKRQAGERWVWFHAASSGEFEQGRPLIERYKVAHPQVRVLLTFFSPSGYEQHKNYQGVDLVTYLPFATRRNARRLIETLRPEMAVFVKYEYWPAYLRQLSRSGVPTYVVCALFRPEQAFFRWWGAGYRSLLRYFTRLFVQDQASADLLAQYGFDKVTVAGDTRFDRVAQIADSHLKNAQESITGESVSSVSDRVAIVERFASYSEKVIIAGSTWLPDEKLLVRYLSEHEGVRLVLVPHETTPKHLNALFQLLEGRYMLYSEATERNVQMLQCMVVDEVGMLSELYRYATVTYIGGGFGAGIHNTLEAAVYDKPVIFGPRYKRFREAQGLIDSGGGFSIGNYRQLRETLDRLLREPSEAGRNAGNYVRSELCATNRIIAYLSK